MNIAYVGNYKGDGKDDSYIGHTGTFQAKAFEQLGWKVDFYDWRELDKVPRKGYDFYYNTDSSSYYEWPNELKPLVFWCGDPQVDMGQNNWRLTRCQQADIVFTPNEVVGRQLLETYGISAFTVHWAYSANWSGECDPFGTGAVDSDNPFATTKDRNKILCATRPIDIECIGNPTCQERIAIWDMLEKNGYGWRVRTGRTYNGDELKVIMTSSKIGIQINSLPHNDHFPNRPLEIMASGQLLLTARQTVKEFDMYFEAGKEFLWWDNLKDLEHKIKYYLAHDGERLKIARAGYEKTIKQHEYYHKALVMQEIIFSRLYDKLHGNKA